MSSYNQLVLLLRAIGEVLLDDGIADADVRDWIYQEIIPKEQLEQRVEECELLARPADYNCLDFVESRYNYTRQFSVDFLETINLRPNGEEDDLFGAIRLIKQYNETNQRKVPK